MATSKEELKGQITELQTLYEKLSPKEREQFEAIADAVKGAPDAATADTLLNGAKSVVNSRISTATDGLKESIKKLDELALEVTEKDEGKTLVLKTKDIMKFHSSLETFKEELAEKVFTEGKDAAEAAFKKLEVKEQKDLRTILKTMTPENASQIIGNAHLEKKNADYIAVLTHRAGLTPEQAEEMHKSIGKIVSETEKAARTGGAAALKAGEKELGTVAKFLGKHHVAAPVAITALTVASALTLPNEQKTVTGPDGKETTEEAGWSTGKTLAVAGGTVALVATIFRGHQVHKMPKFQEALKMFNSGAKTAMDHIRI